jgi:hypothetical protein
MRVSLFQNFHFYRTDRYPGRKGGTAFAVRKGSPHNHVFLPSLISVEATGVCIPIGNSEVLLAAVYKSTGRAWNDADIPELSSIRLKSILEGDLNAKKHFELAPFQTLQVKICHIYFM